MKECKKDIIDEIFDRSHVMYNTKRTEQTYKEYLVKFLS